MVVVSRRLYGPPGIPFLPEYSLNVREYLREYLETVEYLAEYLEYLGIALEYLEYLGKSLEYLEYLGKSLEYLGSRKMCCAPVLDNVELSSVPP